MDEDERAAIIRRVNRQSATVGASMPETVRLGDESVDLSAFVVETRKLDRIPPEATETIEEAKRSLRAERERRIERLESAPLDRDDAEELADEVVGIDRALNALENIRQPDYGEVARTAEVDDYKRWLGFLDEIT